MPSPSMSRWGPPRDSTKSVTAREAAHFSWAARDTAGGTFAQPRGVRAGTGSPTREHVAAA